MNQALSSSEFTFRETESVLVNFSSLNSVENILALLDFILKINKEHNRKRIKKALSSTLEGYSWSVINRL